MKNAVPIIPMRKLNLGCGNKKIEGFINVDKNPNCRPDIFVDLDKGLSLFENDSIDEIRAQHVLEHVDDLMMLLNEMYRVSKPGALWNIYVPHFSYGFVHPFHKRGFSYRTFTSWFSDKSSPEYYGNMDLTVQEVLFNYTRARSKLMRALAIPINFLANLHKPVCERIWCYWVGGFEEIHYTIRVNKSSNREVPS